MEDRSSRCMRTLVTQMAPSGLSGNEIARALIPMMARSTRGSNQRPDTLMQDRTSASSMKVLLQRTAGRCPLYLGEFNESTQHLLILADEEVCEWRGMHGPGSRRNRRLSCGSAGRAVNVWRTSRERLRGGTRAASIGSWLAMEGLLQRHAGGLWERCGLRSAKRFREA